ncbi:MAG: hypothetical protein IJ484_02330 [Oscillospiraceae bacterium]|nr:hypothetical protein [Oscillospiraceae bacterium]
MDAGLRRDINGCISDLRAISRQLNSAADELERAMDGFGSLAMAARMRRYAQKYTKAADKLSRVR